MTPLPQPDPTGVSPQAEEDVLPSACSEKQGKADQHADEPRSLSTHQALPADTSLMPKAL